MCVHNWTFNPRFQGIHFVSWKSNFKVQSNLSTFNPRFQGIHFVRSIGVVLSAGIRVLSIPVFRGFILLDIRIENQAVFASVSFQSPFSGDSFCQVPSMSSALTAFSFQSPFSGDSFCQALQLAWERVKRPSFNPRFQGIHFVSKRPL